MEKILTRKRISLSLSCSTNSSSRAKMLMSLATSMVVMLSCEGLKWDDANCLHFFLLKSWLDSVVVSTDCGRLINTQYP